MIASPLVAECNAVADWLAGEGFQPVRVSTVERVIDEIKSRPLDLLLIDFTFAFGPMPQAVGLVRARNPKTPIIVLGDASPGPESHAVARGAMYLPRPVDRASLLCTVAMAVMESRPLRRSLRKRVARFEAVVDGVPSHIIDVSNEGLRLEIPRGRKAAPPPPVFNVRVPILGVTLLARRMWTSSAQGPDATWYGSELSRNTVRVQQAWLSFVDAIPGGATAIEIH